MEQNIIIKKSKKSFVPNPAIVEKYSNFVKLYKQLGFCVMPLQPNTRIALKDKWTTWGQVSKKDLLKLWEEKLYNIGIVVGRPSRGLVVIEANNQETVNFLESFDILSKTVKVKSKEGIHYYLQISPWNPKVYNKEIATPSGLSFIIRAKDKYVVAPPSRIKGFTFSFIPNFDDLTKIVKLSPTEAIEFLSSLEKQAMSWGIPKKIKLKISLPKTKVLRNDVNLQENNLQI